jgi:hypothetical protein
MHSDLLDAEATIEWADSQIPLFQQEFINWQRANPYPVIEEMYPDGSGLAAVVYDQPFPLTANAWVGAIINGLRSGLDLIAAALAVRNGKKPDTDTHFPIYRSIHDFIDPKTGIESKKWLSIGERAAIKALKPYEGGDATLWPLHRLDILRKHQRLIVARPEVAGYHMAGVRRIAVAERPVIERLENKTVLFRLKPGERLYATQGNTLLNVRIFFDETALGPLKYEVPMVLKQFSIRVSEILNEIDRL